MYRYFVQPPSWIRLLYPKRLWRIDTNEKKLYLTFDDGPHPRITLFVLDLLRSYQAKASFFCIGQRVKEFPEVYERIQHEGHRVGNHTHTHVNGWRTTVDHYEHDIRQASRLIDSNLFRPPYGRLRFSQATKVSSALQRDDAQIVMWDLLSGDFDTSLNGQECLDLCKKKLRPGSIIVLHDSEKAWDRLEIVLPSLLEHATKQGYSFDALP
ncbi:MAG: polysaccharide deacetylase family protein [Chitinophagaceae bacterium]|jgi:peptidoglycan/xylan/chitin deacetylase (PgdA/CDA1 family)